VACGCWAFGTAVVGGLALGKAIGGDDPTPAAAGRPSPSAVAPAAPAPVPLAVTFARNVNLKGVDASAVSDASACFICQCNEGNLIYVECGHAGICRTCATQQKQANCAICRAPVRLVMQIYKV
jgi:hypothetical protein